MSKKIVKTEVRSAVHIPRTMENEDTHYVRLLVTYDDGSTENKIQLIENYERPVYVTSPPFRNHIEKKEDEDLDKLIVKYSTDTDLYRTAANMLGNPTLANTPYELRRSPYVYGIDMSAANLIKLESLARNDFKQTPYTIAMLDLETDMVRNEILIGSVAMFRGDVLHIHTVVAERWVKEFDGTYEQRLRDKFKELYPEESSTAKLNIEIHKGQLDMIKSLFRTANIWAPDWLSAWNIEFDLGETILDIIKRNGKNPIDYLCDERVPRELRRFDWEPDPGVFINSNGRATGVTPEKRWHKVHSTTTFHLIDSMCTYKALRLHHPNERSYRLDYILRKHLPDSGKVEITGSESYSGVHWHEWAQEHAKVEYGAYNIGDIVEPLYLDKKNKDLELSLPVFAEACNFNDFGSSNRKIYPALYHYCLQQGTVLGVGANMESVYNKYAEDMELETRDTYRYKVLDANGWIQALPQDNVLDIGVTPYPDYPWVKSRAKTNVADMDSVSSYPSCTIAGNVSKSTCVTEVIELEGFTADQTKEIFLGLIVGNTNTLDIVSMLNDLPTSREIVSLCLSGEIDEYMDL